MDRAGYLNSYEKRLIKLGIVFKAIKQAEFGMRDDELIERKNCIKMGKPIIVRPSSGESLRSGKSSMSMSPPKRKL